MARKVARQVYWSISCYLGERMISCVNWDMFIRFFPIDMFIDWSRDGMTDKLIDGMIEGLIDRMIGHCIRWQTDNIFVLLMQYVFWLVTLKSGSISLDIKWKTLWAFFLILVKLAKKVCHTDTLVHTNTNWRIIIAVLAYIFPLSASHHWQHTIIQTHTPHLHLTHLL